MTKHFFEDIQAKRQNLLNLANHAKDFGWIDASRRNEIEERINNDVLTIGIIGQMKCGKSTFLNAFIFEDEVLPTACTPMTSALTVIKYGEEDSLKAEFYSEEEWNQQILLSRRSTESLSPTSSDYLKIQAARELVDSANRMEASPSDYLGNTQIDSLDHLAEYVGASGRFTPITKAVTINSSHPYMRGVEIVDTPGFNDPIVSREERTREFLNKADVVILMLYAGRPFDESDRNILIELIQTCGIGRILIGINKYDMAFEEYSASDLQDYVKEQLNNSCADCSCRALVDLIRNVDPIAFSAEMALLSVIPTVKINCNCKHTHDWDRFCNIFEINSQSQMRECSHIDSLTRSIRNIIENERDEVLFNSLRNSIVAAGEHTKLDIDRRLADCSRQIDILNCPDDRIESALTDLGRVERRVTRSLESLQEEIECLICEEVIPDLRRKIENITDKQCREMDNLIDGFGRLDSIQRMDNLLQIEVQALSRNVSRIIEDVMRDLKTRLRDLITDFINEVVSVSRRYIDDVVNINNYLKIVRTEIGLEINEAQSFNWNFEADDSAVFSFFRWLDIGIFNCLTNSHNKDYWHSKVNTLRNNDMSHYFNEIRNQKDEIIQSLRCKLIEELINPIKSQYNDVKTQKVDRTSKLQELTQQCQELREQLSRVEEQLQRIGVVSTSHE